MFTLICWRQKQTGSLKKEKESERKTDYGRRKQMQPPEIQKDKRRVGENERNEEQPMTFRSREVAEVSKNRDRKTG